MWDDVLITRALLYSDGSNKSLSAAVWGALMMSADPAMRLTIISFVTYLPGHGMQWDDGTALEYAIADVEERLTQSTGKIFDRHKVKAQTVVGFSFGTAGIAESIVNYARRGGFNLIIMGVGQQVAESGFAGSIVEKVLESAAIPVLLVKKLPGEMVSSLKPEGTG